MHRFENLLHQLNIDVADLPPGVDLNGVLLYLGTFPHGSGRLLVNPSIQVNDNPEFVTLVAHELSHLLLNRFAKHPANVLDLLLSGQRELYNRYEAEADRLAASLLAPRALCAQCPGPRYPTPDSLARELGIPLRVVQQALQVHEEAPRPIRRFLARRMGQPDFTRPQSARAA